MIRPRYVLFAVFGCAVGCGAGGASPAPVSPAGSTEVAESSQPDVTEQFGWLSGHWVNETSSETWVDAGSAMIGVGMGSRGRATEFFEVMIIDRVDGALTFTALPNGLRAVDFASEELGEQRASFANPDHDYPQRIEYQRAGDQITTRTSGKDRAASELTWLSQPVQTSEELEARDRQFAADSAAQGDQAWVVTFAPKAAMWTRRSGLITGNAAVGEAIKQAQAEGSQLVWEPMTSGISRLGDLGFTIGRYRMERRAESAEPDVLDKGVYVMIWRRQHDGRWLAVLDAGVPE